MSYAACRDPPVLACCNIHESSQAKLGESQASRSIHFNMHCVLPQHLLSTVCKIHSVQAYAAAVCMVVIQVCSNLKIQQPQDFGERLYLTSSSRLLILRALALTPGRWCVLISTRDDPSNFTCTCILHETGASNAWTASTCRTLLQLLQKHCAGMHGSRNQPFLSLQIILSLSSSPSDDRVPKEGHALSRLNLSAVSDMIHAPPW